MENDSLVYVAGKFYNPFHLDSDEDILIIETPSGEARFKLDLLVLMAKKYGRSHSLGFENNGEQFVLKKSE